MLLGELALFQAARRRLTGRFGKELSETAVV